MSHKSSLVKERLRRVIYVQCWEPCLGVSHFPVDKAADCAWFTGPTFRLQTGLCMPYGPQLRGCHTH